MMNFKEGILTHMKFTKRNLMIASVLILIPVLFQFLQDQTLDWTELSNTLFLVSLPLVIIGLFGWVFSSGTFDFFHYSMRKTTKLKKKKNEEDDAEEELNPHALSTAVGKSYQSVLTIGVLVFLASVLCLWDYFL